MAQGTIKIKKGVAPKRSNVLGPKKGARTIAPKRTLLVKNAKMAKVYICPFVEPRKLLTDQKHSAGLIGMTERTLGSKAGHLEMLKGGKKNKDGVKEETKKGGTKKFG
jgi:hypothetical protein